MAPLLELDDPAHENAAKTASNARTPLFETLPLEVSQMLYILISSWTAQYPGSIEHIYSCYQ